MSDEKPDFDDIVAGLEDEIDEPEAPLDLSTLSIWDLLNLSREIQAELTIRGSLVRPFTDEDKDLQDRLYAIRWEIARR